MRTLMEKEKTKYLKLFHTLLGKMGGNNKEIKAAMLDSFGVESSRDLTTHQLLEACDALEREMNPQFIEMDKARKRLIAAIGGWLKAMNYDSDIGIIKGVACRAAGVRDFNRISLERLRSLYNAFLNKQRDLDFTKHLTSDMLKDLTSAN